MHRSADGLAWMGADAAEEIMRHWNSMFATLLALTAYVALAASDPALAAGSGPVCREPAVVDEMTREIRAQLHYTEVDPRLITEQQTTSALVVRCQVCVQMAPYDMLRFGERPIARCVAHDFEVRILPRGFVVRDLR